jgi:Bacterial SH3 domain
MKNICFRFLALTIVLANLQTLSLQAEESKAVIQSDLLKASLPEDEANTETGDTKVTESDLEKATKKLQEEEAKLLEQAGLSNPSSFTSDADTLPSDEIKEANKTTANETIEPMHASLDLDKTNSNSIKGGPTKGAHDVKPHTIGVDSKLHEEVVLKNAELEGRLKASQEKVDSLLKELDDTRNRLMIAETQVERLSSIIETKSYGSIGKTKPTTSLLQQTPVRRPSDDKINLKQNRASNERPADDMQVATVIGDKVMLRTGPGKDHSPLMAVSKGNRLAVETRNGEWYRVIAPSGVRAWISSDVVSFGMTPNNITSASRVRGFSSELE